MSSSRKLKREILRQAVAQNLETSAKRGGAPAAPDRRRWLWPVVGGAALVATSVLVWLGLPARESPQTPATAPAEVAEAPPRAVRRIALDPGHGGDDLGAVVADQVEKNLTLDIASRLRTRLEAAGLEVFLTRQDDRTLSLRERVTLANAAQADAFVSIHLSGIRNEERQGVETYYLGATDDPDLEELARQENRGSGYALADLRRLLEGIYTHPWRSASRRLAESVQQTLYRSLLPVDPGLHDRGANAAPLVVLVATEMPAILADVACLSTRDDLELLAKPRYRDHLAQALERGILSYTRTINEAQPAR